MGIPIIFCPSLRKVFSSSKRAPATRRRSPFNNNGDTSVIAPEREMHDEGMTLHSPGCFGPQATQQIPSQEIKANRNKPLATIRKFLKRKSPSSLTIILLQATDEAQIPAGGTSQNTALVVSPVDPCIGHFNVPMETENTDRETEEKSPLSVSSKHPRRTVTCDVKQGNHESMAMGDEGSYALDVQVVPSLEKEKDNKTENDLPSDSLVETCSNVTETSKTSARVTLTKVMKMEGSEKTIIGGRKEKGTEDRDKDEDLQVTIEDDLGQEEMTSEGEMESGARDCVSGPVKPSSGSTFLRIPALYSLPLLTLSPLPRLVLPLYTLRPKFLQN